MTIPEIAAISPLIMAVVAVCGMLGRGVVWLVQQRSGKTITTLQSENDWLWAQLLQCEDESDGCMDRLRGLGLTP